VNIPRFHAEHAHAAITAGCHVYAAKPVAIDVPRALKVEAAGKLATEKKLVYLVDYQIPTDPILIEVVKRIHEGGLGKLMYLQSNGDSGRWPDPADKTVEELMRRGHWLSTTALSGDFIVEYSVHSIDAALWVAGGRRPVCAMGRSRRCRDNANGDGREIYMVTYEFDDGLVWTHHCQALNNSGGGGIKCEAFGDIASAMIPYGGKAYLRGGPKHYGGGEVTDIYLQGARRNIATFYKNVIEGYCENLTVKRAVTGALSGILGRESTIRKKELTMEELIKENKELELDISGLKI
jgi:predicted dehydrogenase